MRSIALIVSATLLLACATPEQRTATVDRAWSLARGVCTVCNNACRLVPGAPQNAPPASP